MKRQLLTALMIAATSVVSMGSLQADCGGHGCHTGFGFNGFYARYGCSPREAFVVFQRNPQLVTQFPQMARFLQAEFGAFTTTPAAVVGTTGNVTATGAVAGTVAPIDGAVTATPVDGAAVATPGAPAAVATPAVAPVDAAAATPAPVDAPPAAAIDAGQAAAPAVVDPVTVPTSVEGELPPAAVISPELEPLLGLWVNESDAADQPIAKINLANDGNALVTVNTALGQSEVNKPFAVEDGVFKLGGDELAKVVSANADKVVLDANGTNLTFIRP